MNIHNLIVKTAGRLPFGGILAPLAKVTYLGKAVSDDSFNPYSYLESLHPRIRNSSVRTAPAAFADSPADLMVVVPVYNAEKYLKSCLDSIFSQKTKYSFNVVIVNDGSTDGSAAILDGYRKSIGGGQIITQENRGYSGSRNRALEQITGRYVCFVDSDDIVPPGAFEALLDAAYSQDADIVQGAHSVFTDSSVNSDGDYMPARFAGFPWGKVFRAELFEKVQLPLEFWFEDTVFSLIILEIAGKKILINSSVYDYRKNPQGISAKSRGQKKCIDSLWVTLQMLEDRNRLGVQKPLPEDKLLSQLRINTTRIASIGDTKADYANFMISRELFLSTPTAPATLSPALKRIAGALRSNDFKSFVVACEIGK